INPAFDVTPASLITAIVTERGVARAPFGPALRHMADGGKATRASAGPSRAPARVSRAPAPDARVSRAKPKPSKVKQRPAGKGVARFSPNRSATPKRSKGVKRPAAPKRAAAPKRKAPSKRKVKPAPKRRARRR